MGHVRHIAGPRAGGGNITIGKGNAVVTLHGSGNTVAAGDGNVKIAGASSGNTISLGAGQDQVALHGSGNTFALNGSTASLLLSGPTNMVFVNGGTDVIKDSPNGTNLALEVGAAGGSIAVIDFSPASGSVGFAASLFPTAETPADIVQSMVSDGHGGSALGFNGGYVDFVGVALGSLTANNFHIA